ncbi:hypothetical protein ACV07N_01720 [Roseivirga echinicomitans]
MSIRKYFSWVLLLLFIVGCAGRGLDNETDEFKEFLLRIGKSENFFKEYRGVVIIPVDRCSSCVSVASIFASDYSDELRNVFFVVTEINTFKELKIRYKLYE